ncbi:nucleotidyl transferase AbiEii/AbiGii toxin family protein [Dehalobacter restrictus]|nr:nucleotidyl transferase AbiEii/AbiGii toxin family protein [Dehalobacter restrictus]
MQNYMLERLLERISLSKYHPNLILKGGFLISAIVGLDTRATMDLDTTIKGFDVKSRTVLSNYKAVMENIASSEQLKGFWEKYQSNFDYARDVDFADACQTISQIFQEIGF